MENNKLGNIFRQNGTLYQKTKMDRLPAQLEKHKTSRMRHKNERVCKKALSNPE